jgi:FkbM family methyltransferase
MSSQYGEHERILEYFADRQGRFLDIGAFDGKTFSNTKSLADLGWSGVCVEPSPPAFCALMATYKDNPKIELVNAAVSNAAGGLRTLYVSVGSGDSPLDADMVSTINREHMEIWREAAPYRPILIPTLNAEALYRLGPFDFINVDVEGGNLDVLLGCAGMQGVQMLCIEADPIQDIPGIKSWLDDMGLTNHEFFGGNILASRPR